MPALRVPIYMGKEEIEYAVLLKHSQKAIISLGLEETRNILFIHLMLNLKKRSKKSIARKH